MPAGGNMDEGRKKRMKRVCWYRERTAAVLVRWVVAIGSTLGPASGQERLQELAELKRPDGSFTEKIRALFLIGGEFHCYEACSDLLTRSLQMTLPIEIERLRIDRPPEGAPRAEKATLPSKPEVLEDSALREKYDLILSYTQEMYIALTPDQRDGLLHFVRKGGGFVGIHSASDTLKADADYISMIGGRFESHPPFGPVEVKRLAGDHPVLAGIDDFVLEDEFYHLNNCRLDDKQLLLIGTSPGDRKTRPIAWTKTYGEGRVFYTILGHSPQTFVHETFRRLLANAVQWVAQRNVQQDPRLHVLFDGHNLEGWTQAGPGGFVVEEGVLRGDGGMGLLWYTRRSFRDFVLEVDFKVSRKEDNSGIFLRFPDMPRTPWDAVQQGYEVQICDVGEDKHNTGSIYSFQGVSELATLPPGEWNHYQITVIGDQYTVELNGKNVCTFNGERGREGYVGLQNHDPDSKVSFRNIRVRELAD